MESLQILRWDEIPSTEEFVSRIEKRNLPAVISGCIKDWKAISKWDVSKGGLDYLQGLVGASVVEAMLSKSAPVFYGDIRSHDRVPLPFSSFVDYCKNHLRSGDDDHNSVPQMNEHKEGKLASHCCDPLIVDDGPQQVYLAQVPIMTTENEDRSQLECLREDIDTPSFLKGKLLSAVNLWMNSDKSRSSTHYDPHHNLLCIISGCKQVNLWPPSATPFLYPFPLHGEASNHSAMALENPNFGLYPMEKYLDDFSHKVILQAGDALFIPEGWFHQVDSESLTIAVNFWWGSDIMSGMLEHMDSYYLRRILKRMTDKEMDRMLCMPAANVEEKLIIANGHSNHGSAEFHDKITNLLGNEKEDVGIDHQITSLGGKKLEKDFMIFELEPLVIQSLHELVTLVHDRVKPESNTSTDKSARKEKDEINISGDNKLFNLKEDPIAHIIWTLDPHTFQGVFLAMAHNFPRTLEAFLLHALSPVCTEVLTRKFEQMDRMIGEDDRSQFYQKFYSVFDNQFSAMDALLNQKELFAFQAFKNVLSQYLGINIDGSVGRMTSRINNFHG